MQWFVTGSADRTIKIWEMATGRVSNYYSVETLTFSIYLVCVCVVAVEIVIDGSHQRHSRAGRVDAFAVPLLSRRRQNRQVLGSRSEQSRAAVPRPFVGRVFMVSGVAWGRRD